VTEAISPQRSAQKGEIGDELALELTKTGLMNQAPTGFRFPLAES
jgi:hypothetical protein